MEPSRFGRQLLSSAAKPGIPGYQGVAETPPPTPPPDPALEAARKLVREGEVVVEVNDITYKLTKWVHSYEREMISVQFRRSPDGYYNWLNRGWKFKTVTTYDPYHPQVDLPESLTARALTILQPIFAGIPVHQLTCDHMLDEERYTGSTFQRVISRI